MNKIQQQQYKKDKQHVLSLQAIIWSHIVRNVTVLVFDNNCETEEIQSYLHDERSN